MVIRRMCALLVVMLVFILMLDYTVFPLAYQIIERSLNSYLLLG